MNPLNIRQHLRQIAKSRWALSTVVTTLIVLVISVLLAGVVSYFAINVTSTRVQEESLHLTKQHAWFSAASGTSQAAIMIINTGGRDVVVDKLTVRGQECDWSKVFYTTASDSVSGDLFYNSTLVNGGSISVGGSDRVFKQASNDLTVQSGRTLIIYLHNPDSISVNDIGLTVSINIFTSQAMYYKETNVQGTSGTSTASSSSPDDSGIVEISYAKAYYSIDHADDAEISEVAMILTNGESIPITISKNSLTVKGQLVSSLALYARIAEDADSSLPFMVHTDDYGLTEVSGTATIQPGEQVLLYFLDPCTYIHSSDVGQTFYVGIDLEHILSPVKEVTVAEFS